MPVELHPQYIVDASSQLTAVVLPAEEWHRLLEALEMWDDIRAYDNAKKKAADFMPFDEAMAEIDAAEGT